MKLSDAAQQLFDDGDIEACLTAVSLELALLEGTAYDHILDLEFINSPYSIASAIDSFRKEHDCKAISIEYDNFWGFDIFGFDKCGDKTYEWIGDFCVDTPGEELRGMDTLKPYFSYKYQKKHPDQKEASHLCETIVTLKFFLLIRNSIKQLPHLDIPVIVCNHDSDSFLVLGDTSKMVDYDHSYHEQAQKERDEHRREQELEEQKKVSDFHKKLTEEEVFYLQKGYDEYKLHNDWVLRELFSGGSPVETLISNSPQLSAEPRARSIINGRSELQVESRYKDGHLDHAIDYITQNKEYRIYRVPVISKELASVFQKTCPKDIELIPVSLVCKESKHNSHYILNVSKTIEGAIDKTQTKFKWRQNAVPFSQDSAVHFWPLTFLPGAMGNMHIGRLYEDMRKIFISNTLANAIYTFEKSQNIRRFSVFSDFSYGYFIPLDSSINSQYHDAQSSGYRSTPSWAK